MVPIDIRLEVGQVDGCVNAQSEVILATIAGCVETIRCLGDMARFVDRVEISFYSFEKGEEASGPCVQIHCKTDTGRCWSYGTDYRYMEGDKRPSKDSVVEAIYPDLKRLMVEYLKGDLTILEDKLARTRLIVEGCK